MKKIIEYLRNEYGVKHHVFSLISTLVIFVIFTIIMVIAAPRFVLYESKQLDGWYFPDGHMGLRIDNLTAYRVRHVINHEVGHHIWLNCLNDTQKMDYAEMFEVLPIYCREKATAKEDFAEGYASFMLDGVSESDCVEKYRYFRKLSLLKLEC